MDAAVQEALEKGRRKRPWESLIVDRAEQMKAWIPPIKSLLAGGKPVYVYFNNHYAGYAPESVELFEKLFRDDSGGSPEINPQYDS